MLGKKADTSLQIDDLIAERWSPRAFDINKIVSQEQIIALCEAARWAPSCAGDEPWRFIVWNQNHNKELWEKAFNTLEEFNKVWVKNAPVLILSLADSKWRKNRESDNYWSRHDAGAAAMNLYLQAKSLGLITHPMGGFKIDAIKSEFNIPDEFEPMAMIAVGYQAELDVLDDYNKKREVAARSRQPLGSSFFNSEWAKPII